MIQLLNKLRIPRLLINYSNINNNTKLLTRLVSSTPYLHAINETKDSNNSNNESYLTWQNLNLHPTLITLCKSNNLHSPNQIQFNSLKSLLNNEDTLIEAETGSGKTQAYILLALQKLIELSESEVSELRTPSAMILVPNKELIWQITKSFLLFKPLLEEFNIKITLDKTEFKQANHDNSKLIYIGTPSNLFNNLTKRELNELSQSLKNCKLCILDEVDFLLSRSYLIHTREMIPYLCKILNQNEGTFALVGATSGIKKEEPFNSKLLNKYFMRANRVTSDDLHKLRGKLDIELIKADKDLKSFEIFDWKLKTLETKLIGYILDKIEKLKGSGEEVAGGKSINVILFANSMNNVNLYSEHLQCNLNLTETQFQGYNLNIHKFHKKIPILEREESLKEIILTTSQPKINLIISTDLLSRGIDLPLIDLVIQADIPSNVVSYIHRSGRTARFEREGKMICLVTKLDGYLGELIERGELPSIESDNINDDDSDINNVNCSSEVNNNNNKKLDSIFSKRRSLNKRVKRYNEIKRENDY